MTQREANVVPRPREALVRTVLVPPVMPLPWPIDINAKKPLYGRTVLIVDDDPDLLRILVRVLVRSGARAVPASDAASAVIAAVTERVDVLLTDVELPGCDGPSVAREIIRGRSYMAVVFMSGTPLATHVTHRRLAPQAPFIRKPFDPAELVKAIAAAVASVPRRTDRGLVTAND